MLPYIKMHGLGNDFVVLDKRRNPGFAGLTPAQARLIADRRRGIGCDQIVVLDHDDVADVAVQFINADGSLAGACGNASRCVARLMMEALYCDHVTLRTPADILGAWWTGRPGGDVTVDMGAVRLGWQAIPLASPANTQHMPVAHGPLKDGAACNMGNPHITFFVEDADAVDLATLGPLIEHDPIFPERVNVEVASLMGDNRIRMRVWERGAGITEACGSGACATLVAAARQGRITGRKAEIVLDGGSLLIDWRADDDHVLMSGPASWVADGKISAELLARADDQMAGEGAA